MKLQPANLLRGTVILPGDKSISHRAAILASMAVGETRIENFGRAADCQTTLKCLSQLGVPIEQDDTVVVIKGSGKTGLRAAGEPLDCGNSGTTARLLAGLLAGQRFESVLTGDASLRSRPMRRVIEPLRLMGAEIESENERLPIKISGITELHAVDVEMRTASAQVKSCIMLAGLFAKGKTTVFEPTQTRDHTERMFRWFGVDVETVDVGGGKKISVNGDAALTARDMLVPSDISSAAFFIVAAICLRGSDILIPNVGLNPTRTALIDVLRGLGANLTISSTVEDCNEPRGAIRITGGFSLDESPEQNLLSGAIIPNIIDEIPILAVLGTQVEGGIEVRDAAELRVKESDRISAVVQNLKSMGAGVVEYPDGFKIERSQLRGAQIDAFGDHRIAMAFAIAGTLASGETEITGAECVNISFPGFFDMLAGIML